MNENKNLEKLGSSKSTMNRTLHNIKKKKKTREVFEDFRWKFRWLKFWNTFDTPNLLVKRIIFN